MYYKYEVAAYYESCPTKKLLQELEKYKEIVKVRKKIRRQLGQVYTPYIMEAAPAEFRVEFLTQLLSRRGVL